jgi:hypothetical protein
MNELGWTVECVAYEKGTDLYDADAQHIIPFAETKTGVTPIYTLFFDRFANENDKRHRPFWWMTYRERRGQRRNDVKQHLSNLGFDPSIVDRVFLPKRSS